MALPLANTFDGGTDDVAVSAANSGGTSGNAFDVVSIGAGSVGKFENSQSMRGGMSFEFSTGVTPESTFVSWSTSIGTYATVYGRFYIRLTAAPAANISVLSTVSTATARARLQVTTLRKLRLLDAAGATIWTSTAAMSTNTWYRIEFNLVNDAAAGVAQVKLFTGHSTTVDEDSGQFTAVNFGGTADRIRYGCVVNAASFPQSWMDDLQANATAFPGPSFNSATIATTFSFTDPATAVVKHPATVATAFSFSGPATAVVKHPASVATALSFAAPAAAVVKHPASVATTFAFSVSATATVTAGTPVRATSTTTLTVARTSTAAASAGRTATSAASAGRTSAPTVTGG